MAGTRWRRITDLLLLLLLIGCSASQIHASSEYEVDSIFYEPFSESFEGRWIVSSKDEYQGVWKLSKSEGHDDYGLLVSEKARKYAVVKEMDKAVSLADGTVVLQFEVRLQNGLECGGAYLKYLRPQEAGWKAEEFDNESPYSIMFGPDKCGSTNKVHFIFKHKNPKSGEYVEHHIKDPPSVPSDKLSHVYTAILKPDNEVRILIDGEEKKKANFLSNKDFEPALIPAKTIPDPEDKKPEDWDDEEDGVWEPTKTDNPKCSLAPGCGEWKKPMKHNPAYKGKWSPPMIDNPSYKGIWKPREIPNPDYFETEKPNFEPIAAIGIEIWTMQDGILFDNMLIADDEKVAESVRLTTWKPKFETEKEKQKAEEEAAGLSDGLSSYQKKVFDLLYKIADVSFLDAYKPRIIELIEKGEKQPNITIGVIVSVVVVLLSIFFKILFGGKKPAVVAVPEPNRAAAAQTSHDEGSSGEKEDEIEKEEAAAPPPRRRSARRET
ncbi:unnamed protein product [Malus baccata var. baccata]